jgi:hypothetical protein
VTLPCLEVSYLRSASHPKLFNIAHFKTNRCGALRGPRISAAIGSLAAAEVAAADGPLVTALDATAVPAAASRSVRGGSYRRRQEDGGQIVVAVVAVAEDRR